MAREPVGRCEVEHRLQHPRDRFGVPRPTVSARLTSRQPSPNSDSVTLPTAEGSILPSYGQSVAQET
jgi:hypothetical protein